jgi:hypothetical protein
LREILPFFAPLAAFAWDLAFLCALGGLCVGFSLSLRSWRPLREIWRLWRESAPQTTNPYYNYWVIIDRYTGV